MIFNSGYYNAMDRNYYAQADAELAQVETGRMGEPINLDEEPNVYEMKPASKLGPQEIGTGTHPMQNTMQSLTAKIRSGAGKIEFEFIGQGKTSSQQPGPESFDARERQDMRDLVEINKIRTSTHAAIHGESLSGLTGGQGGGQSGFRREAQQKVTKEIEKAIQFAGDATRGGAVVFHSGEWPRPIVDLRAGPKGEKFSGYPGEETEGTVYFADKRTGDLVSSVRKDQKLYEPIYKTVKVNGKEHWVDVHGRPIPKDADIERLFDRVPEWNKDKTNFNVAERDWNYFVEQSQKWNKEHPDKPRTPGQLYLITMMENRILELKGNSLYHAQRYDEHQHAKKKFEDALKFYNDLEKDLPEEKKRKLLRDRMAGYGQQDLLALDRELPSTYLKRKIKDEADAMRHIHESSASADARAEEEKERLRNLRPIEQVGLTRTFDTISKAGITAMKYTEKNKDKLAEPIYVAPENFMPQQFGSHPDEVREIILGSRKSMKEKLQREGYTPEKAKKMADTHIKATLDVGHMNLWRQHFERKEGESIEERDKRFNAWLLSETKKLAKEGIIGHIHLTDNFGYDDEHLTPGRGNVPMQEFIKNMEEAGLKDFIAEAGSFNGETVMHDTWALMNGPVYGVSRGPGFAGFRHRHFGYSGPPNYIVGGYSPSNEWKLWSEVPLE